MLSRSHRLSTEEVQKVLRDGSRARSTFLSARFVTADEGKEAFAAVVPLRVAKSAVKRNVWRRMLYNSIARASVPAVRAAILLEKIPDSAPEEVIYKDLIALFERMRPTK